MIAARDFVPSAGRLWESSLASESPVPRFVFGQFRNFVGTVVSWLAARSVAKRGQGLAAMSGRVEIEGAAPGGIVGAFMSVKNGLTKSAFFKKAKSWG